MKVLVVDDHQYNRELLGFILEDHGHEPVYAENGVVACDLVFEDHDIDLILMDVMMPEMDGLDATRKIKTKVGDRFLPILFVTALDNEKNITDCLDVGGDDFVPKPINENILVAKLKAHERSKKLYDRLKTANEELSYHRTMTDRELNIVEHIFKNGSDRVATHCENIVAYTSPMSMFNGDLVLSAPSPSGGVYGLLGDFTGHGLASSIGSLPVTEVFFNNVNRQASISQIANDINHRLKILLPQNMFFCAAIFELDRFGEAMTLWMGGMNDVLALHQDEQCFTKIESSHMPLGILSDEEFDDSPRLVPINKYKRLFIYTDGVTEAHNPQHEEFGEKRLEEIILASPPSQPMKETVDTIVWAVTEFAAEKEQSDDVSILAICPGEIVHTDKKSGEVVDVGDAYHAADSIPWTLSIQLNDNDLKQTSVVNQVMSFVSSIQGIELHQDKIFTIVSELYNNSLEHGVLRLDSSLKNSADGFEQYYILREQRLAALSDQFVNVEFRYLRGDVNILELTIEDSGDGFDVAEVKKRSHGHSDEFECSNPESHGRGISLLEQLCSELEYTQNGRQVRAVYELKVH